MQTIGERLEEARKRRGISIREAAEATKIRGDFLNSFENNRFDINLPEIYVRGFLRTYATFLKINPEKIATDYNATLFGEGKPQKKESRELFGRMEIADKPKPAESSNRQPAQQKSGEEETEGEERKEERKPSPQRRFQDLAAFEKSDYLKIGAIVAGGLIVVLVIFFTVRAFMKPHTASTPSQQQNTANAPVAPAAHSMILIGLDNLTVKVTESDDGRVLFDGPVNKGERIPISYHGNVQIAYSNGSALQIEKNGQRFRMPTTGKNTATVN